MSLLPILSVPELRRAKLATADAAVEETSVSLQFGVCMAIPLEMAALGLHAKPCLLREGSKSTFAYAFEKP